ncbi:hypothetical protein CALVIDRAFT_51933 [Calocera viscosa TUFC12733]|uniref:Uncharacterized protein n=1 Tax=Calocera viscosa (strain TUFC12733) TaxID=1330018 RepID=A0A167NSU4_CALVF|nr:hypothetical protein CALVIDRAFT_51933 [Calocera viscosa TUFC12733]
MRSSATGSVHAVDPLALAHRPLRVPSARTARDNSVRSSSPGVHLLTAPARHPPSLLSSVPSSSPTTAFSPSSTAFNNTSLSDLQRDNSRLAFNRELHSRRHAGSRPYSPLWAATSSSIRPDRRTRKRPYLTVLGPFDSPQASTLSAVSCRYPPAPHHIIDPFPPFPILLAPSPSSSSSQSLTQPPSPVHAR